MSFGQRLRQRREELKISREELAQMLGVTRSAIGNYETGISSPKEEVLLKLFDALQVDPNYLYRDSFSQGGLQLTAQEQRMVEYCRKLPENSRQALFAFLRELNSAQGLLPLRSENFPGKRRIPLYFSPAAAGYASPVLGDDYEYLLEEEPVPAGAEFAVRIQGDSMQPYIQDHAVVYVKRAAMKNGDVGIFCVDGEMVCKQYHQGHDGEISLLSLNRQRADADVHLPKGENHSLVCFGRVLMERVPLVTT